MNLTKRQISKLNKIMALAQDLLDKATKAEKAGAGKPKPKAGGKSGVRRRSSADAAKMRADILAKRAQGKSAASLAKKYGVSTAYIYMIKE